jgi:HSP20 family protein
MVTRYEPWSALRQLQSEMNRAFGQAMTDGEDSSNIVTSSWTPAVDIKEEDDRFELHADVPGVNPEDIEVTMENGVLTIKGERKFATNEEGSNGFRRIERLHGTFYRRFSLPDTADAEKIAARGANGVLEVVIPKKAAIQPKRIAVAS